MRGRIAFLEAEQDRVRVANHELARWIGFSFHDPKKLPDFKRLADERAALAKPVDANAYTVDDAKVRGHFIAMAMSQRIH